MVVRPEAAAPVRARGAALCTPADLLSQIPASPDAGQTFLEDAVVLPQESFLTFRWACLQRLRRQLFSQVDKVYIEAHGATRAWLEGRRWNDRPTRAEVVRQLRALTSQSRSSTETLVRLRAAQAAYFRDGVLVQIDDARPLTRPEVPAVGVSPPLAARLRRLVTPACACALALTMTAGLNPGDLIRLRISDLHDGTLLTIGGEVVEVPAHAAGLVRAQLLARSEAAGADGDPVFVHHGQRLGAAPLARQLENAARLAGVWPAGEERRPPWEPAPADGFNVRLVPIEANWEAAGSPRASLARRRSRRHRRPLGGGCLPRRVQRRPDPRRAPEALDWTLVRVERAVAALDGGLRRVGMRLALHAERIVVVGRLDRTDLPSRLSLERLAAGALDPALASFLWDALAGIVPERIKDRETFDTADRLGLVWVWHGPVRVSQPVEYSFVPGDTPALRGAALLTNSLRIH